MSGFFNYIQSATADNLGLNPIEWKLYLENQKRTGQQRVVLWNCIPRVDQAAITLEAARQHLFGKHDE